MKNIYTLVTFLLISFLSYSQQSNQVTMSFDAPNGYNYTNGKHVPNCPVNQMQLVVHVPWAPNSTGYNYYKLTVKKDGSNFECLVRSFPSASGNTHHIDIPWEDGTYTVEIGASLFYNGTGCSAYGFGSTGTVWSYISSPSQIVVDVPDATLGANVNGFSTGFPFKTVCSSDDIVVNRGGTSCEDRFQINVYNSNSNGDQVSTLYASGWVFGQLPSPLNLSSSLNFVPGNYYKVNVVVGLPWSQRDFFIYYKDEINPVISAIGAPEVCDGSDIELTVSDQPSNWGWTTTAGGTVSSGSPALMTPAQTGVYNITTTESCVNLPSDFTVTVNDLPQINVSSVNPSAICMNDPGATSTPVQFNASVTPSNGSGIWSSSNGVISSSGLFDPSQNLIPATFDLTYTHTDANGCVNSKDHQFGYYDPSILTPVITDVTCNGYDDGQIEYQTSGTPQYYYLLDGNIVQGPTISNLAPGTYSVDLVDGHNCSSGSQNVTISEPTQLTATTNIASPYTVDCYGYGAYVVVTASGGNGGYQYDYGSGYTSSTASLMYPQAATQEVNVTDSKGCTLTTPIYMDISEPTEIQVNVNTTDATCLGLSDGSVIAAASGGTPSYNYQWSGGLGTNFSNSSVAGGNYTLSVTDANGCLKTENVTVNNGSYSVSTTVTKTDALCLGASNGEINISAGSNYNWDWNNGQSTSAATSSNISGLYEGNYHVTITDYLGSGCQEVQTVQIDNVGGSRWAATTSSSNGIETVGIDHDDEGNIYVLSTYSQTSFNNGTVNIDASPASQGFCVVKYDQCGNFIWVSHTSNIEWVGIDIKVKDNMVFVLASTVNTINGNLLFNTIDEGGISFASNSIFFNGQDYVIMSIEQSGSYGMGYPLNQSLTDYTFNAFDVLNSLNGDVLVGGRDEQLGDAYIGEYNVSSGVFVESVTNTTSSINSGSLNSFNDIVVTTDVNGNADKVFATGVYNDINPAGVNLTSLNGTSDAFVTQFDVAALSVTNQPAMSAGTYGDAEGQSIQVYTSNYSDYDVYVTGSYTGDASGWSLQTAVVQNAYIASIDYSASTTSFSLDWSDYIGYSNTGLLAAKGTGVDISNDGTVIYYSGLFNADQFEMQYAGMQQTGVNGSEMVYNVGYEFNGNALGSNVTQSVMDMTSAGITVYDDNAFIAGNYLEEVILIPTNISSIVTAQPSVAEQYAVRFNLLGNQYYKSGLHSAQIASDEINGETAGTQSQLVGVLDEFKLIPNPAKENVRIVYSSESDENWNLQLYSVVGSLVYNKEGINSAVSQVEVNISELPIGVYIVHIHQEGNSVTQKLVVE